MTIQAYQTLYESSIAYGMRKALQAEQSKAEMLIKIQSIEDDCADLEEEVDDLKRRINKMLKENKADELNVKKTHEEDVNLLSSTNNGYLMDLKKALTTFEEVKKEEEEN